MLIRDFDTAQNMEFLSILGKKTLERHRHTWEDNIRMHIIGTGWMCGLVSSGSCEHGNEPSGSMKGREFD
jgi:hypothetical protein